MRVGIFGTDDDPQVHAVAREIRALGAEDILLRTEALDEGLPVSDLDGRQFYRGLDVTDLDGAYLRSIPAAYAPYIDEDEQLTLYEDWFVRYMHEREKASFAIGWLLSLQQRGVRLVNGPHAASVLQYKPFQLHTLRALGASVPRTLISNDPEAVLRFRAEVKDVIFKPVMGGAVTLPLEGEALENLESIRQSPVIFQERIIGDDLRVMLAGNDIVSCVAIRTPQQHLDFRDDPSYSAGDAAYEEVVLPHDVQEFCRKAARSCGLVFAGIDIKKTPEGKWVFLELNSSPIYLDVEMKMGHPISRAIAELTLGKR